MLNPRRALIAAAFILTVFFLITRSHNSESPTTSEPKDAEADALSAANAQQRAAPPPPPQKPMIDMSGMSTYEKLAYAYDYDIESKFPAYIWQTWKKTPSEADFEFREQEASWSIEHPGFIHEVITDSVADTLLQLLYGSIPEVLEARRIQFCQWTIQSKPGHPVLRDIISRITNQTLEMKKAGKLSAFQGNRVVDLTGPAVWTDTIMDYFNDERYFDMENSKGRIDYRNFTGMETSKRVGDVVVLPITSFSPGVGQMGAKDYDDPMAFVKHDFEGTWKPESERHIGEVVQELGEGQGEAPQGQ
ncbi:glycosyltransferase family 32 protein [Trichoderma longibrachiatum ATCC 18648]|uniref:Glycosyltransferase family 32 protein n=1 Tax=Trichoderma longibrachiatum ATCC 18648 TaxID=983965 RepID=A0A2T4C5K0_TRILO|nr:glycosyltransferase family 32 protein [Trichoderma longibrachiatum ATCC 18648]